MRQPILLLWAVLLCNAAIADGLPRGTTLPANSPIMSISPTSFDITLPGGGAVTRILTVSNSGVGTLEFAISISPANAPGRVIHGGKQPGNSRPEKLPSRKTGSSTVRRSPWDLLLSLDLGSITGGGGNAGAETDGSNFYCARSASNLLYRIDPGGNLLEEFSISGVSGLRDLAFDGSYMYGGSAGNTIYQMDFTSKTLIGTIPSPVTVRHIAYDEGQDGFWVGTWDSDIVLLSRSGAVLATIPAAIHNLSGIAGSAYDGWTAGGPYLWIFDQGAGPGTPQLLRQFHLPTLSPTAFAYDVSQDFPGANGLAGGLFSDDQIIPGKAVIGGIIQASSDYLFAYELTPLNLAGWVTADPLSGMVPPASSQDITLTIDPAGLLPGIHAAYVIVSGNDPFNPADSALVRLTIPPITYLYAFPNPLIFPPGFLPDTLALTIYNAGNVPVAISDITASNSVFIPLQTAFAIPPFDSSVVEVVFLPGPAGLETGTLSIFTNDPSYPQLDVDMQGEALAPPAIEVSPEEVTEVLYALGDSLDVPVQITNTGGAPLVWSASLSTNNVGRALAGRKGSKGPAHAEYHPHSDATPYPALATASNWDLQFSLNLEAVTGALGNAGTEFDGTYFYSTRWASNLLHKIDTGGNLVEEFSIPGVSGLRDLAFDGNDMYGGAAGNLIYQMDFNSKTLTGTISAPVAVRHIAYDEARDAFWVGNWDTDIYLVSRSGATLSIIPAAVHGLEGMYGSAYGGWSPNGPHLWVFDQGLGSSSPQLIHQIDLNTHTPTGMVYDVAGDFPTAAGIAGGLFTMIGFVPGTASIGGILQGTPDNLFVYDVSCAGEDIFGELIGNTSGSLPPSQSAGFILRLFASLADTTFSGALQIATNVPDQPLVTIPVTLQVVVGIEDEATLPAAYALSRNYPNPFNPTTTIDYQLPEAAEVRLAIYNLLGQQVRTLVAARRPAGRYKAQWDGRNTTGEAVGSGVYLYRFSAGGFVQVRKMLLVK